MSVLYVNYLMKYLGSMMALLVGWWGGGVVGGGYLPLWLAQNKGTAQPAALFFSVCVCPTAMFLLLCLGHHRPVGQMWVSVYRPHKIREFFFPTKAIELRSLGC